MPPALCLLGVPALIRDGKTEAIPPSLSLLLVAYLAYDERWLSRTAVAGLLWPDKSEARARQNLSQLLYVCKEQPWAEALEVEKHRLRYGAESDLTLFRAKVAQGQWSAALETYGGEFLHSISLKASAEYEVWLAEVRQELHGSWRQAAVNHSHSLIEQSDFAAAADLIGQALQHDELAEDLLQTYLRCHLELDEAMRQRALQRFGRFVVALRDEMDLEPLEETLELAEALKVKSRPQAPKPSTPKAVAYGFPVYPSSFIGRDVEQLELDNLFSRPEVRLVTLLGPGGIGKTRLAVQFAQSQAAHYPDGAVLVQLAALGDARLVPSALLDALGVKGQVNQGAREQALNHLQDKSMLIVFDNFELVVEASEFVQDLLDQTPCRVLTTSREALGLAWEFLYDLQGLMFPATPEAFSEEYDAVQLFIRSAQRVQPAFYLGNSEKGHMVDLCALLEGSALGLELAASWLRVLTLAEVVQEVRKNLDFLADKQGALPDRHQSLRAVFDYSWELLSLEEQTALARLSVFRGGFVRDGAQAVTEVWVRTLLALVNKSLLQRSQEGRFDSHATLQQFSHEKLSEADASSCRLKHATYLAELAAQFRQAANSAQEIEWLERIRPELDNVRSALRYTLETQNPELGLGIMADLWGFWYRAGLVAEAKQLLSNLQNLPQEQTSAKQQARGYDLNAVLHRLSGDFSGARKLYQQSLQLFEAQGDERGVVAVQNGLGIAAYLDGDPEAARLSWEQGLALAEQIKDPNATANLSTSLGFLAKDDSDHPRMRGLFQRALEIYQGMGHKFGIMTSTSNLGFAALHQGELEASLRFQHDALKAAVELNHNDSIIRCLEDLASLAAARGQAVMALQLAAATAAQRNTLGLPIEPQDQASLEGYLVKARAVLDDSAIRQAVERGAAMTLREAAQEGLKLEPTPIHAARVE
jgi:predicted ATPase/DNA-binding SARP family transcriptional activator